MERSNMSTLTLVNPSDKSWTRHRYVLWFGAYGTTRLMVWANSLDDAFDECVDWCVSNAPGLLATQQVHEEYQRLLALGMDDEKAMDEAQVDMSCGGNAGDYVASYEWGIVAEDPTREEILSIQGRA